MNLPDYDDRLSAIKKPSDDNLYQSPALNTRSRAPPKAADAAR
jgi:hypothetical protein